MGIWIALCGMVLSIIAVWLSFRAGKMATLQTADSVPEHIWDELRLAIPEADYNFLRSTSSYMGAAPADMISRLNYIGAAHDPQDPKQVRITILELRLADVEREVIGVREQSPSDTKIMWLAVSSVAGISSLTAFVFFLLQQVNVVQ